MRTNYLFGSKWEDVVGYSRVVKVGNVIEVAGTVASDDDGNTVDVNDAYLQTKYIIQKIQKVLEEAGATLQHIVRTRMFVTDISKREEYGKRMANFFQLSNHALL